MKCDVLEIDMKNIGDLTLTMYKGRYYIICNSTIVLGWAMSTYLTGDHNPLQLRVYNLYNS
jgi:hypothetical protein